jgi:nucleoside-diphosphate-sugar epimerase
MMPKTTDLTVAVTGPTGTFGFGFVPLLESDSRIRRVVGIARRPFDPSEHGWTKLEYRQGDVRDASAMAQAFEGADVVVHLAFLVAGGASEQTTRDINLGGTINAFRAAASANAQRFVYASSVAAYGFHADNPIGMTEEWPVRPATHLFYAQEKAELERLLTAEAERHPVTALYRLRPPVVLGPHTIGAKSFVPRPVARTAGRIVAQLQRSPVHPPAPASDLPMQFVHEADVGRALLQCVVGAGPPGAYNVSGDGVVTVAEVVREAGFWPVPVPSRLFRLGANAIAALPTVPFTARLTQWAEAATHPAIMDTSKAKSELGWKPEYTSLEALREALRHAAAEA